MATFESEPVKQTVLVDSSILMARMGPWCSLKVLTCDRNFQSQTCKLPLSSPTNTQLLGMTSQTVSLAFLLTTLTFFPQPTMVPSESRWQGALDSLRYLQEKSSCERCQAMHSFSWKVSTVCPATLTASSCVVKVWYSQRSFLKSLSWKGLNSAKTPSSCRKYSEGYSSAICCRVGCESSTLISQISEQLCLETQSLPSFSSAKMERIAAGSTRMKSQSLMLTNCQFDLVFIVEVIDYIINPSEYCKGPPKHSRDIANNNRLYFLVASVALVLLSFILALIIILVIIQKASMKKKEIANKPLKSRSIDTTLKKTPQKVKSKSKDTKKQEAQFFVLLGDNFYVASSKTQRRSYEQFEQKVKVASSGLKKNKVRGHSNFQESINLQQYVKTLSKEEKERLLRDLSKEIQIQKSHESSLVEQKQEKEDKMLRLTQKLQSIKGELVMRWDDQISKVNHSFQNEQIGLEEKNEKIMLIQKIKNNKIAMINYTKTLFAKILTEEPDIEVEKSERMANIINSLNSISSMDPRDPMNLAQLDAHNFMHLTDQANHHFQFQSQDQISKSPHSQHDLQRELSEHDVGVSDCIKIEDSKDEPVNMSKEQFKLDLRLDEVQFGKDHYDDEVVSAKETPSKHIKQETLKLDFIGSKKDQANIVSPLALSVPEPKMNLSQEFLCMGEEHQIQIPLLMTKDRLEQIQLQKTAKQVQILGLCIKNRKCFQQSEIIFQNTNHFTTLIDINIFIVQFYEYIMRKHLDDIIKGLNIPYGNSCADKLNVMRHEGFVPDFDQSNVIPQSYLLQFYNEFLAKQNNEAERIHHLAVFHAFNIGLNVYRPYFQLEGEVFPWITSEKGLTFYEISQDNIEEVFEKSKMKVLEYCSSLCGLMPECEVTTAQAIKQLGKLNEDVYERVLKAQLIQKYGQWAIKRTNFQAMSRISFCQEIYKEILEQECLTLLNQRNATRLD